MNATKRKFNALLNGIGNKSTTSLASDANADSPTIDNGTTSPHQNTRKRRELRTSSVLASVPANIDTRSNTSISNAARNKKSTEQRSSLAPVEKPKYAPWDRAAFLERLRSFSNLMDWTPKPAKVNEVEWAKRGWVCQKFERVRCCLCNVEILVKLNKKEVDGKEESVYVASQIEDALVDRYAEMIITSHADHCLWKQRGCDDKIFKLSLNQPDSTLRALRQRYDGLCAQAEQLPYMHNLRTPDEFNLETTLAYLAPDFFATSPLQNSNTTAISSQINKVAITMALFGWRSRPEHMAKYGASQCESCFRNLGLWLFKSKEVNDVGEETRPASMNHLDMVEEHRDYCPWRNPRSQNGDEPISTDTKLAAWQVLLRLLKNDHYLKRSAEISPQTRKQRPMTMISNSTPSTNPFNLQDDDDDDNEDARSLREEKDKQRWARLKRVKSLFDTKASKRMSRGSVDSIAKTK